MDWTGYRNICDRGDVLSRFLLERTAALLETAGEDALAMNLRKVVAGEPLPKPHDHRGGASSDFFVMGLDTATIERIVEIVHGARCAGSRTPEGRSLGGFVEAWQEYLDWQNGRHPRSPNRLQTP